MFRDAIIGILAALAKQERVGLSERVRVGLQRAKSQGQGRGPSEAQTRGTVGHTQMILEEMQKRKLIAPSFVLVLMVMSLVGLGAYHQGRRNVAAEQLVR